MFLATLPRAKARSKTEGLGHLRELQIDRDDSSVVTNVIDFSAILVGARGDALSEDRYLTSNSDGPIRIPSLSSRGTDCTLRLPRDLHDTLIHSEPACSPWV